MTACEHAAFEVQLEASTSSTVDRRSPRECPFGQRQPCTARTITTNGKTTRETAYLTISLPAADARPSIYRTGSRDHPRQ
jgi:hypothetical protein